MFSINDYIIYGRTGVCKITDIKKVKFGTGDEKEYYIIKPIFDKNATIYAPIDSKAIKIKPVMTIEEVKDLIKNIPDEETIWIEDNNLRKEEYTKIIKNGNRNELVKLLKTLHLKKEDQDKIGKKLNINDEKIMNDAEKLLHEELALVLNIKLEDVVPFIIGKLNID